MRKILRRSQVELTTGLSRSTIYRYMSHGTFPKPIPLGPRAVGWIESDIADWLTKKIEQGRMGAEQAVKGAA